jgi:tartrate dehydratase beta subunit/fumarate hydratase class I family protein
LANNPYHQAERERTYGRSRSLSVGDVVQINGDLYLCRPTGWVAL